MARGLISEEYVTKTVLLYLQTHGWTIVSYDFPGSGTGALLRPCNHLNHKNKGKFIPDIVAFKNKEVLVFENKVKKTESDFQKLTTIAESGLFDKAILDLCEIREGVELVWCIAFNQNDNKFDLNKYPRIDIVLLVNESGTTHLKKPSINLIKT